MRGEWKTFFAGFRWKSWKLGKVDEEKFEHNGRGYHSKTYALGPIRWDRKIKYEGES